MSSIKRDKQTLEVKKHTEPLRKLGGGFQLFINSHPEGVFLLVLFFPSSFYLLFVTATWRNGLHKQGYGTAFVYYGHWRICIK